MSPRFVSEFRSALQLAAAAGLEIAEYDSDYDCVWPRLHFNSLRNALLSGWACWRESVKRLSRLALRRGNGDLLFARLTARNQAASASRDA